VEKDVLLAVSVPPSALEEVEVLFRENGAAAWRVPHVFEKDTSYASFSAVEEGLQWLPDRLDEIERELSKTRKEWGPKLAALFIALDEKTEVVEAERGLVEKGELFFVEGWVPSDALPSVVSRLRERFDRDVLLSWRYPSEDEWHKVPTALSNPGPFAPFELFLKLLSLPKYSGIDPTVLIGIFFPFFSGCMIGDVGYGFFIGLFGFLARRFGKSVLAAHIGSILYFVAGWSIAWGFVYGELFGDMGHRLLHMRPLWVERSEAVMPVLVFTVVLGLAHVCLGHFLGFIEGIRSRHKHLWMEKLGNLVILLGLVLGIVVVKGWLPDTLFSLSLSSVLVGTVVLLVGGGLGGIIEYLGSIGNILSYVRIGAIGLSSAILAMVASSFVDVLGISILGIMMALAMHLLNFVLALAGSGLHAARLHYVEFLGKFYVGGGIAYRPFGKRRSPSWKKP
jgi:V/A-type H+-transporting ATPase subunit I